MAQIIIDGYSVSTDDIKLNVFYKDIELGYPGEVLQTVLLRNKITLEIFYCDDDVYIGKTFATYDYRGKLVTLTDKEISDVLKKKVFS